MGRGHHTEDDVKDSAQILTGYRVDTWNTWRVWYDPDCHWTGRGAGCSGFTHANAAADGRAVTEALPRLPGSPPRHRGAVARKLAIRFVSDAPSDALVRRLADVYLANDTAIVPVLQALVAAPEFAAARGDQGAHAHRRRRGHLPRPRRPVARPRHAESAANAILWQASDSAAPFGWARPDGQPETGAAWSSASRVLASLDVHYAMCGGWWPTRDATYHPPASWVPLTAKRRSIRFDALVDHLSRTLSGRAASAKVLRVARGGDRVPRRRTRSRAPIRW